MSSSSSDSDSKLPTNRPGRRGPTLDRTTLRTSRLMEFCSKKELVNQTGHQVSEWPLVIVKELVDNFVDACEEAGVTPEIAVTVDPDGITVADNGPGIPPETIAGVLDFSVRTSSREAYVAPDRGAQGNALKTIVAMPFVLDSNKGSVEIVGRGVRHQITMSVDQIRQEPVIDHQQSDTLVKSGTSVKVYWPNSASDADDGDSRFLHDGRDYDEEEDIDLGTSDSASSILRSAKSRFLQVASNYTFLNPHLALTVDWFGERMKFESTNPEWQKWRPSDPTCPHWYKPEHFDRLIAGYIAHDTDVGADRTVRELVAEFRGFSGSAKQKRVLDATVLARVNLSALANRDGLRTDRTHSLLAAMKEHSKPVKPTALGIIGKDHLAARFQALGCDMETFDYKKVIGETDDVPWVIETAFGWLGDKSPRERRLVTGVNWSPGIKNPFRQLGKGGESLDSLLQEQRAGRHEPIVLVLHIACPRVEYTDRGKTGIALED